MVVVNDKPILGVETAAEWAQYLEEHLDSDGVRLKLRKTASAMPGIAYAQALDVRCASGGSMAKPARSTRTITCGCSHRGGPAACGPNAIATMSSA